MSGWNRPEKRSSESIEARKEIQRLAVVALAAVESAIEFAAFKKCWTEMRLLDDARKRLKLVVK